MEQVSFNLMAAVNIQSNFRDQENKTHQSLFPFFSVSIFHEVIDLDVMILAFWVLTFKPARSLFSFTLFNRLFSYFLSAIRVVLSAYLRLLISLPSNLIPVCNSSSLEFCMMYYTYKLKEQGENIWPWRTHFPILNQSIVAFTVLLLLVLYIGFSGDRRDGMVFQSL